MMSSPIPHFSASGTRSRKSLGIFCGLRCRTGRFSAIRRYLAFISAAGRIWLRFILSALAADQKRKKRANRAFTAHLTLALSGTPLHGASALERGVRQHAPFIFARTCIFEGYPLRAP